MWPPWRDISEGLMVWSPRKKKKSDRVMAGAHKQRPTTPILDLCNGIFRDQAIFGRVLNEIWLAHVTILSPMAGNNV